MLKKISSSLFFGGGAGGLILLSWGVDDINGFLMHSARAIMFFSTVIVFFFSFLLKDKFGIQFIRTGEEEVLKHRITVILTASIAILLFVIPSYSDRHTLLVLGDDELFRYFGVVFFIFGTLFMVWGPAHLGKQFSAFITLQKDHQLVTDGPFRYMRHPRYSGIIFWGFGIALIFRSILGLLLAVLMAIFMVWRIPDEEKLLQKEFRQEWEEYCEQTKKLIPFIY